MVHGILQFTPTIAVCYVLHRCESLDIRCRESFEIFFSFFHLETPPLPRGEKRHPLLRWGPWRIPRRNFFGLQSVLNAFGTATGEPSCRPTDRARKGLLFCFRTRSRGRSSVRGFDNDPSAGSPTETLLRLLLPLNDKVQWTSRDVAGSEPLASPPSEHFTGPFNR